MTKQQSMPDLEADAKIETLVDVGLEFSIWLPPPPTFAGGGGISQ
jgi:hypothetical protein